MTDAINRLAMSIRRRGAYTKLTALCKSFPAVASLPKSADANFLVFRPAKTSDNIVGGKVRRRLSVPKPLLDARTVEYLKHVPSDDLDSMRDKLIAPVTRGLCKIRVLLLTQNVTSHTVD